MRRTPLLTCLLLATAWAVAVPAGAHAATTLATVPVPTVVGAAGGWTAWSEPDGSSFALVTRAPDGAVARPPVARRGVPFDLDLGADGAGRPVATYSRCATEPSESKGGLDERPSWRFGRGCRIAVLDLTTGAERRIALRAGTTSNVLPSLAGSRLAYVSYPGTVRRVRRGRTVVTRRSTGEARVRDLRTGRDRRLHSGPLPYRARPANALETPLSVDTDGRRVAVVWAVNTRELCCPGILLTTELRVQSVTGRALSLAAGADSGGSEELTCIDQVQSPTLTPSGLTFLRRTAVGWYAARGSGRSVTYGTAHDPALGRPQLLSAAVDGSRLVVAERPVSGSGQPTAVRIAEYALGAFGRQAPRQERCVEG